MHVGDCLELILGNGTASCFFHDRAFCRMPEALPTYQDSWLKSALQAIRRSVAYSISDQEIPLASIESTMYT